MKSKKFLLILALMITINLLLATASFATTGTITGKTVRVREKASTDAEILTNAYRDDKVKVIEKSGEWYKIEYEGFKGYVHGDYLKVAGETQKEEPTENETEETTPTSSATVASINVGDKCKLNKATNLYIIPVLYSSVIENLDKNDNVTVLETVNHWVYVETQKYTGWIVKAAIEETTTQTPEPEPTKPDENQAEEQEPEQKEPEQPKEPEKETEKQPSVEPEKTDKKVGYVNVEQANVREGPSTDYEHVITAKQNQELKILGEKDGWYQVELKGVTGYISKKLVSDEKVEVTTSRGMSESRIPANEEKVEVAEPSEEIKETTTENKETEEKVEAATSTKGSEIVAYAKKFLGGKYVSGGNTPATGMDCSGYTKYVFAHFGYTLSRTTSGQAKNGTEVARSDMQEGDLIIFLDDSKKKIGHVGIYIGNDQFIHSANAKRGIVIDSVYNSYYDPRFVCVRRII